MAEGGLIVRISLRQNGEVETEVVPAEERRLRQRRVALGPEGGNERRPLVK